jgi:antitoxin HicB
MKTAFLLPNVRLLPGCISQGKTCDEAMANIRDAIQDYVESLKKHGEPIPAIS